MTNTYKSVLFGTGLICWASITCSAPNNYDPPSIPKGQTIEVPVFQPPNTNRTPIQSESLQAATVTNVFLFQEDFETGGQSWTRTGSWQVGSPTSGPNSGYNSPKAAATNLSGNYSANANDSLTSPQLTLTTAANVTYTLIFNEWYKIESFYDKGYVEISTNGGGAWIQLDQRDGSSVWRETTINLNSYAGKNILLRFRLASDYGFQQEGWYVDNIRVIYTVQNTLQTSIDSLNHQNFPFIFMDVNVVDDDAVCPEVIPQSSFVVKENNVIQTQYFQVTPPNQSGGVRLADIVFIMDNSGSMDNEQTAVQQNVFAFVDSLSAKGVDSALGLTRYGANTNDGDPIIEDNGSLTSDDVYFKNTVWNRNVVDGSFEPGYKAIVKTAESFQFRPGASRNFIIITDETPAQGSITVQNAKAALDASDATLFVLTDTSLINDFTSLVKDPDKQIFNILSPFDQILTAITNQVSSNYILRYRTFNDTFDGVERLVNVAVTCSGDTGVSEARYTPGSAPQIVLTNGTIALSNVSQQAGVAITIGANVTDSQTPLVQSVTLYYRTHGNTLGSYTAIPMINSGGTLYQVQIPATAVIAPGIDYYITATDGVAASSSPKVNPAELPYQISVLPNRPPVITHAPITRNQIGKAISVASRVVDTTNSLASVTLNYRRFGTLVYKIVAMTAGANNSYSSTIPGNEMTVDGIDYFIKAVDNFGISSFAGYPDIPIYINSAHVVTPTVGVGGTVNPNTPQLVNHGAKINFTVNPNTGYIRNNTVGGNCPQGNWNNNVWTTGAIVANCTLIFSFKNSGPTAITNAATSISRTSVTLNGEVNGNGSTTTVTFDFGTTTNYGTVVPGVPSSVYGNATIIANLTRLICDKTYHFRVKAVSSAGTTNGDDKSFKTLPCLLPPVINSAIPNNAKVTLKWNMVAGAISYNVYQGTVAGGESSTPIKTGITGTLVDITGLTNGTTYYFKMRSVDSYGVSALSNEVNARPGMWPDMIITDITLNPISPVSSTNFSATVTVKNAGTIASNAGYLRVWSNQSADQACNSTAQVSVPVGVLASNQSKTMVVNLIAGNRGNNVLRAYVDGNCTTPENDESNNQMTKIYRVAGMPDFVITAITMTPTLPKINGSFNIAVTVKNQGYTESQAGFLEVWTNQSKVQKCGTESDMWADVGVLAGGASKIINITGLPSGSEVGGKILRTFIDSWCETPESNELNNQFTKNYTVQ